MEVLSGSTTASLRAIRVHYLLASHETMQMMLMTERLSLELFDAGTARHKDDPVCVGRSNLRFDRFSSGRSINQEKQDVVLPMATSNFGMIGLALSIGIICDGRAQLPDTVATVYTRGKGVFWPAESYHSFHALPDVWIGSMSATQQRGYTADRRKSGEKATIGTLSQMVVDTTPQRYSGAGMPSHKALLSAGGKSDTSMHSGYSGDDF